MTEKCSGVGYMGGNGSLKGHARKVCVRLVKVFYEPYQALSSASMSNGTVNFAREHR